MPSSTICARPPATTQAPVAAAAAGPTATPAAAAARGRARPALGLCAPRGRWSCCAIRSGWPSPCSGPLCLMLAFGYGISFDVEHLRFAALDRDRSAESRALLQEFAGSRYFAEQPPADRRRGARAPAARAASWRWRSSCRPGFGRDLLRGRQPEVAVTLDGAMPFRAETARGYVDGRRAALAEPSGRARAVDPARAGQPLHRRGPLSATIRASSASSRSCPAWSCCCWR